MELNRHSNSSQTTSSTTQGKHTKNMKILEVIYREQATAGATSAGNIATVASPHIAIGRDRFKKSYHGSPGKSGTKAPKLPKIVQNIAIPVKIVNSPNSEADSPKRPATLLPSPVAAK